MRSPLGCVSRVGGHEADLVSARLPPRGDDLVTGVQDFTQICRSDLTPKGTSSQQRQTDESRQKEGGNGPISQGVTRKDWVGVTIFFAVIITLVAGAGDDARTDDVNIEYSATGSSSSRSYR